jgi:para-aminobenzoate synthetase/4-amino-4-deoxychorismate lyase
VVALVDGKLVTPPVRCGLLPGTFREALIEGGVLQERVLTLNDLRIAEEILLINSVRGWRKAYLTEEGNNA